MIRVSRKWSLTGCRQPQRGFTMLIVESTWTLIHYEWIMDPRSLYASACLLHRATSWQDKHPMLPDGSLQWNCYYYLRCLFVLDRGFSLVFPRKWWMTTHYYSASCSPQRRIATAESGALGMQETRNKKHWAPLPPNRKTACLGSWKGILRVISPIYTTKRTTRIPPPETPPRKSGRGIIDRCQMHTGFADAISHDGAPYICTMIPSWPLPGTSPWTAIWNWGQVIINSEQDPV